MRCPFQVTEREIMCYMCAIELWSPVQLDTAREPKVPQGLGSEPLSGLPLTPWDEWKSIWGVEIYLGPTYV